MRLLLLITLVILSGTSAYSLGISIALEQWGLVALSATNMVVSAGLAWYVYKND